jgi:PKD repeat protein
MKRTLWLLAAMSLVTAAWTAPAEAQAVPALSVLTAGRTAPVEAQAVVTTVVADWELNEPARSSVAADSSGNGNAGQISPDAEAEGLTMNGSYYTWSNRCPACLPVAEGRVVQVPDDDQLDILDDSVTYTLEFRFRTTRPYGNLMQKGQSTTNGGQIKVQAPGGTVQCLFKGADGTRVGTGSPTALDDGQWHTVSCIHTATQVKQFVDGVRVAVKNGATGPINNKQPYTIGGKHNCDQAEITCDYFTGDIDYVKVTVESTNSNQSPTASFSPTCTNLSCSFDSSDSGDPDGTLSSYSWAFGDGATSSAANPSHVYASGGTYQVTLTVTDNVGATDNATRSIAVGPGLPGKPRNIDATAGDQSASVSWSPPTAAGDSPITGYTATASPGGATCTTATLSCTVQDLTNGQAYTFTVVAVSDAGSGPASNPSSSVTPAGEPLAPLSVTAKAGDHQATVTWSTAAANGSPITSYVITQLPGGTSTNVNASVRSTTVTGLVNGHRYHFTVAAVNGVGAGAETDSNVVTPAGLPGRAGHPAAKARANAAVITWTAAKPNGAAIQRYRIVSSNGKHRVVTGTAHRLVFDKLKAGSHQRFRVLAINALGAGSWSKWTKRITVR